MRNGNMPIGEGYRNCPKVREIRSDAAGKKAFSILTVLLLVTTLFTGLALMEPENTGATLSSHTRYQMQGNRSYGTASFDGGSTLYYFGGQDEGGFFQTNVIKYNFSDGSTYLVSTFGTLIGTSSSFYDGNIYIFGGENDAGTCKSNVYEYDVIAGVVNPVNALPISVSFTTAQRVGDYTYIFGGTSPDFTYHSNRIIRYDHVTDTSQVILTMPYDITEASSVFTGDYIYIFGGMDANGTVLDTVLRFDPFHETISIVQSGGYNLKMPYEVYGASATMINGSAYIYGGITYAGWWAQTIMKFNPISKTFVIDKDPLFDGLRGGVALTKENADGDEVGYLVGGNTLSESALSSIRLHEPESLHHNENLHQVAVMHYSVVKPQVAQTPHGVYIAGGLESSGMIGEISRFDPVTYSLGYETDMYYKTNRGMAVWDGNRMIMMGGIDGMGAPQTMVQYFDPKTSTTGLIGNMDTTLYDAEAIYYDGYAFFFGGQGGGGTVTNKVSFVDVNTGNRNTAATLPYPVYNYTLAYDGEDTVWLIGGQNTTDAYIDDILEIDMAGMTFMHHTDVLPHGIRNAMGGYNDEDGYLHIYGGQISISPYYENRGFILDPYRSFVDVSTVSLPMPIYGAAYTQGVNVFFGGRNLNDKLDGIYEYSNSKAAHDGESYNLERTYEYDLTKAASAAYGDYIYSFGGKISGNDIDGIFRFHKETGEMEYMSSFGYMLSSATAITIGDRIYIFGGYQFGDPSVYYDKIWEYDPINDTLTQPYDFAGYGGRSQASACTDGKYAYILGGTDGVGFSNDFLVFDPAQGIINRFSLPNPRSDMLVGYYDGYVYAAGGYDPTTFKPATDFIRIEVLESSINTIALQDLPYGVMGAVGGSEWGHVFVAGGETEQGISDKVIIYNITQNNLFFTDFKLSKPIAYPVFDVGCPNIFLGQSYNPYKGGIYVSYEPPADIYQGLNTHENTLSTDIERMGATFDGTDVYLVGGVDSTDIDKSDILSINKDTLSDTYVDYMGYSARSLACTYDDVNDKLIYMGGIESTSIYHMEAFEYDMGANMVTQLADLPQARAGIDCHYYNGDYIVIGGQTTSTIYQPNVFRYRPDGSGYGIGNLPIDLAYYGSICTGEAIYTFGGENYDGLVDKIIRYEIETQNTTIMTCSFPDPIKDCEAVYDPVNDLAYIFGGETSSGPVDTIFIYDPSKDILKKSTEALPSPTTGMGAVYDAAMAIGGESGGISLNQIVEFDYITNAPTGGDTIASSDSGEVILNSNLVHTYSYDMVQTSSGSSVVNWQIAPGEEYYFELEVGNNLNYADIEEVNIKGWFDWGDDVNSAYNSSGEGSFNFHFRYQNITSTGEMPVFEKLYPNETNIFNFYGEEIEVAGNTTVKILRFYFTPSIFMHWADGVAGGNNPPNLGQNWVQTSGFNDANSWNFEITVSDDLGNVNYTYDEFGVFKHQEIVVSYSNPYLDAAPGTAQTHMLTSHENNYSIAYSRMNAPFRLYVNITDLESGAVSIPASNLAISGGSLSGINYFSGPGYTNRIYYRADSASWKSHSYAPGDWYVSPLEWYIVVPFGTPEGAYSGGITYGSETAADPSAAQSFIGVLNSPPDEPTNPNPADGGSVSGDPISLSVFVSDPDNDNMDVEFYVDGNLEFTRTGVISGTTTTLDVGGLMTGGHNWYVVCDDGIERTTSPTWTFNLL